MGIRIHSLFALGFLLTGLLFLICDVPTPPPGTDQADVKLILKSTNGEVSTSAITDTVGKFDTIGVVLELTQHIDSVEVIISKGDSIEYYFKPGIKNLTIDTVNYAAMFPTAGDRTVIAKGYIKEFEDVQVTAVIHIVDKSQANHAPELTVNGWRLVTAGDTVRLSVTATDEDVAQSLTIDTLHLPKGATFVNDSLLWVTTLEDVGIDTAIFIAQDNGEPVMVDTDTVFITVSADPVNRPPTLDIEGRRTVVIGDTMVLWITAADPDSGQTVTIAAPGLPDGATFEHDTIRWTPGEDDIGSDTVRVTATDNGDPVRSVEEQVPVTVTATPMNESPVWNTDTLRLSIEAGKTISRLLSDLCSDPDGDAITLSLLPGNPEGDAVDEATWSCTPTEDDVGVNTIRIVASDPFEGADTLTMILTVESAEAEDLVAPLMAREKPAVDSQTTSASSYEVTISCKDASGISEVLCSMGDAGFEVTNSADSLYSAMITGLQPSAWNTVRFIGIDSAPAANRCTLYVSLMYDPEAPDENPPSITLVSPSNDTVIGESALLVRVRCTDESGVARVTIGGVEATREENNLFSATVSDLAGGVTTSITIIATDSVDTPHTDSISLDVMYDNDVTGPSITLVDPEEDSISTGSSSYTVTLECIDGASGVASVVGTMDGTDFTGVRGSGNMWDIEVTGLAEDEFSTIVFTATDSSLRGNSSADTLHIRYDATIPDNVPPEITLISPSEDTTVDVDHCEITVECTDDRSGVASVRFVVGADTIDAERGTDDKFTGTINDLVANRQTTVTIIAVDSTETPNSASETVEVTWMLIATFSLDISAEHGSVTLNPEGTSHDSGTVVELTPVPDNGYHFSGWSGDVTGSDNPASITIDGNKSVTALFEENPPNTFVLTVVANNGEVTKSPDLPQYDAGTVVELTATPDAAYDFTGWDGDLTGSVNPADITMDDTKNVTANFTLKTYELTVEAGTGGSIDAPSSSPVTVDHGVETSITATPDEGYAFDGWTVEGDADVEDDSDASTTVTLTSGDATITANFTHITYTLTVTDDGNGETDPSGDITVNQDAETDITATPASGYEFVNWTITSGSTSATIASATSLSTTVTLGSGDATIRANFSLIPYELTVANDGHGSTTPNGTVQVTPGGAAISISATPASGYEFLNWTVTSGSSVATLANASSATTTVTLTGNAAIRANFSLIPYELTMSSDGHGSTTPNGTVQVTPGGPATSITATPAGGYQFQGWTVTAGVATITNPSTAATTVTLMGNATVMANFSLIPYTLMISGGSNGTTTPSGAVSVTPGVATPVSATPSNCYKFENWTVTSGTAYIANPNSASTTVTLSSGNATVLANWTPVLANGTISTATPIACAGENVVFTVSGVSGSNLTYHWLKNSVDRWTTTSPSLTVSSMWFSDTGTYSCRIENVSGCFSNTNTAHLSMHYPKVTGPSDASIDCDNTRASVDFTVTASGSYGYQFEWQISSNNSTWSPVTTRSGSVVTVGATSTFSKLPEQFDQYIRCIVTDGCSTQVTSNTARYEGTCP